MAQQHALGPAHQDQAAADPTAADQRHKTGFWTLTVGSVGVVYGDIGTSPLYAFKESVSAAAAGGPLTREIILGILSLIFWSLIVIVTLKYVFLLLRADNGGEGGTLTLVALAQRALGNSRGRVILLLGAAGAGLFYGDSIITPAISVLSAVEGLKLVAPQLGTYVVPITFVILIGVFAVQSRGTASVATLFGPVMVIWFCVLALLGVMEILSEPTVLRALSPVYGLRFLAAHPGVTLAVLSAVCLAVTGAEALYADMGHFGRSPIQCAWLYFVLPALVLNYFGQGALLLSEPEAAENPFYRLAPAWALLPMVGLSTLATIIASQAVITGAFSLTRQAVQLGLLPRLEIRFTSASHQGQIYMPQVNSLLLIGVCMLVLAFQSSSALAHAYGVAVIGTMVVSSALAVVVIHRGWGYSLPAALAIMAPFIAVEIAFLAANLTKLFTGGYIPVLMAGTLILLMWTWVKGTRVLFEKTRKTDVPLDELVGMLQRSPPHRVKGTAIFLTSDPTTAPSALLHNLKHNKVLHEKNVVLTVRSADIPRVALEDRISLEHVGDSFWKVRITFGYMETPNIPRALSLLRKLDFKFDIMATSFFLSRRSIRPAVHSSMPLWQDKMFIGLARTATDATDFFQIPTGRVVEVGTQVTV